MQGVAMALMAAAAGAIQPCRGETRCPRVGLEAAVRVAHPELTMADLLSPESCAPLRQAAAAVALGAAPRAGSLRVFDGRRLRGVVEAILSANDLAGDVTGQIPERVVVARGGATKSCDELAELIFGRAPAQTATRAGSFAEELDCAAAPSIAKDAELELVRSGWNGALRRREFAVRCTRAEECVPFLLWTREKATPGGTRTRKAEAETSAEILAEGIMMMPETRAHRPGTLLVKPGQTVTLRWDQSGIRVMIPATSLDGGGLGERVRVRLKNAPRILPAEVLEDGSVRASL